MFLCHSVLSKIQQDDVRKSTFLRVKALIAQDFKMRLIEALFSSPRSNTRFRAAKAIIEAFKSEYLDSDINLNAFEHFVSVKIIQEYAKRKKNESGLIKYHSPYFSVVQSSGFGKTRLMKESALRRINTVYCCLRAENVRGYPQGNSIVRKFIFDNHLDEQTLQAFIACTFIEANQLALKHFDGTQDGPALAAAISDQLTCDDVLCDQFWQSVIGKVLRASDMKNEAFIEMFKKLQRKFSISAYKDRKNGLIRKGQKPVLISELLIVFDEARNLFPNADSEAKTPFFNLRRAFRNLESKNCILVFIDTLSNVADAANFAPPVVMDPSYRPGQGYFNALLPPFCEVLSFDVFHIGNLDVVNFKLESLIERYKRGRPLWDAIFNEQSEYRKGIEFACYKLLCAQQGTLRSYDSPTMIAILSLRFGIIGINDASISSNLVSSHMATLIYLDADRTKMYVRYPAEPALMEAACYCLHSDPELIHEPEYKPGRIAHLINFFSRNWVSGLIDVGDLGRVLARMILALTYDRVKLDDQGKSKSESEDTDSETDDFYYKPDFAIDDEEMTGVDENTSLEVGESDTDVCDAIMESSQDDDEDDSSDGDDTPRSGTFLRSISVKIFLKALIPRSTRDSYRREFGQEMVQLDDRLMNGRVSLIGFDFVKSLSKDNLQSTLRDAFHLGIGIITPLNFPGYDIIIPVYLPDTDTMGFIGIQAKFYDKLYAEARETAFREMDPGFAFQYLTPGPDPPGEQIRRNDFRFDQPYACILFEIGGKGRNFSRFAVPSNKPANFIFISSIEMFGIMEDSNLLNAFKIARTRAIDPAHSSKRLAYLKHMTPFNYRNESIPPQPATELQTIPEVPEAAGSGS